MKKTVLITGTSTGVGYECALLFAQQGYRVYATMRNLDKATPLQTAAEEAGVSLEILPLDVTDYASIEAVVDAIVSSGHAIDLLINNAGAGFAKTLEQAHLEDIDWVTDVNYKGVVRCTKAVLPHMRAAGSGRIINVTSVGGLVGQPFNELYCGAKFAVEGFTEALASYVSKFFNIQFSLVEPGGIATAFMQNAIANTIKGHQVLNEGAYEPIFEAYMKGAQERATADSSISAYQTGEQVAQIILEVAESEQPPLRVRTSSWAEEFCHLKTKADPDGTQLQQNMWSYFFPPDL